MLSISENGPLAVLIKLKLKREIGAAAEQTNEKEKMYINKYIIEMK